MTTTEPTPEAVEELARVIDPAGWNAAFGDNPAAQEAWRIAARKGARRVLAAGYVHLITHLNGLTASERLELGDALCREAAEMDGDDDECIDDTDLCEHGLRFGCEACEPRHLDQCCGGCETCASVCPGCAEETP